jgi:hypothetical protein
VYSVSGFLSGFLISLASVLIEVVGITPESCYGIRNINRDQESTAIHSPKEDILFIPPKKEKRRENTLNYRLTTKIHLFVEKCLYSTRRKTALHTEPPRPSLTGWSI